MVAKAFRDVDARVAIASLRSLESQLAVDAAPLWMLATLLTMFAGGSLLIAAIGQYAVVAFDGAGNVSGAATTSVTLTSADSEPPSAPVLTVSVNTRNSQVTLRWTASTDNVRVAGYRVYRNNVLVKTTTKLSATLKKLSGTWTFYVVAFDAAGNVSAPSNSGTVAL